MFLHNYKFTVNSNNHEQTTNTYMFFVSFPVGLVEVVLLLHGLGLGLDVFSGSSNVELLQFG